LGAEATPERIAERIAEIERLVASATGFDTARGDVINVSAVEFLEGLAGVEASAPGMAETVGRHLGTMINALAFVIVVFLLSWFGLRPLIAAVTKKEDSDAMSFDELQLSLPNPLDNLQLPDPLGDVDGMGLGYGGSPFPDNMADGLRFNLQPDPQDPLAQ